ncbi:MAG: ABC transporter permease subunit [Eubacterium sp.]|nr:ABC transporter permease subunit [Eubacterium sp.]
MKVIIGRELKNYLKNPLYWIGMLVIMVTVYLCLVEYLNIHRYSEDEVLEKPEEVTITDTDVYYGYITVDGQERYERGLEIIKNDLMEHLDMNETEAEEAINDIRSRNMTMSETISYMKEKYSYYNSGVFVDAANKKATTDEVNQYMDSKLSEHSYSYYFAYKFADFAGVMVSFFSAVMLAFLFIADTKKETYELLHTKPITAWRYVLGKFLSGVIALTIVVFVMLIVFSTPCIRNELSDSVLDVIINMTRASALYVMPTVIISTAICVLVSLLFRNPIPAIPIMILYIIYSNLGSYDSCGYFGFYGRFLGLLFRFDGTFFETAPEQIYLLNQILLILVSGICILLGIFKWKKVRL